MATDILNEMQGTLTPDGTLILQGKPTLPAGPVKVRIETIPVPRSQADYDAMKKAAERMDERAEKNAQLYGIHESAVDIVREMRDGR